MVVLLEPEGLRARKSSAVSRLHRAVLLTAASPSVLQEGFSLREYTEKLARLNKDAGEPSVRVCMCVSCAQNELMNDDDNF